MWSMLQILFLCGHTFALGPSDLVWFLWQSYSIQSCLFVVETKMLPVI